MKCPHCRSDLGSRVNGTRQFDGLIYRRRACKCCGKNLITEERPIERMPTGLENAHKAKHKGTA